MTDVFSLSSEKLSNEGVKMRLINPVTNRLLTAPHGEGGEEREMFLVLYGPDSPQMRRQSKNIQRRAQEEANDIVDDNITDEQLAENLEDDVAFLTAITKSGCVLADGKWVEGEAFNDAFKKQFYRTVSAFRGQVLKFVTKPGNYIEA